MKEIIKELKKILRSNKQDTFDDHKNFVEVETNDSVIDYGNIKEYVLNIDDELSGVSYSIGYDTGFQQCIAELERLQDKESQ